MPASIERFWMRVSLDKYELPEAVATSSGELAEICGVRKNTVESAVSHVRKGKIRVSRYTAVEMEDDVKKAFPDGECAFVECEACFARIECDDGSYCDALHDTFHFGERCPFFKFRSVREAELREIEEKHKARASHGG